MPILRLQSRVMSLKCRYPPTIINRCPECSNISSIRHANDSRQVAAGPRGPLAVISLQASRPGSVFQLVVAGACRSVTPSTAGFEAGENFHVYFPLHKRDPTEADVSTFIPQGVAFRAPHERPPLPNSFIPTSLGTSRTM